MPATSKTLVLALLLVGCAGQQGDLVWYKEGTTASEQDAALYECERDTRMSAASFSGGLQGAGEAQAFMARCMNAKGFYPVSASTLGPPRPTTYSRGIAYDANERVACQMKGAITSAAPVGMLAGPCVNGGGVIVGRIN